MVSLEGSSYRKSTVWVRASDRKRASLWYVIVCLRELNTFTDELDEPPLSRNVQFFQLFKVSTRKRKEGNKRQPKPVSPEIPISHKLANYCEYESKWHGIQNRNKLKQNDLDNPIMLYGFINYCVIILSGAFFIRLTSKLPFQIYETYVCKFE